MKNLLPVGAMLPVLTLVEMYSIDQSFQICGSHAPLPLPQKEVVMSVHVKKYTV
jgi:hypothetical protein